MTLMRKITYVIAVILTSLGSVSEAENFAARHTPAALRMQQTCVDYVLGKVDDGSALAAAGLAITRQSKKKTIYKGNAGLEGVFDTVYSVDMGENARGVRGCRLYVVRTDYDTARVVFNAMLNDLSKRGGKLVGQPSSGGFTYHQFAFGQTIIQAKSSFASNSLIIDYYIPR